MIRLWSCLPREPKGSVICYLYTGSILWIVRNKQLELQLSFPMQVRRYWYGKVWLVLGIVH